MDATQKDRKSRFADWKLKKGGLKAALAFI